MDLLAAVVGVKPRLVEISIWRRPLLKMSRREPRRTQPSHLAVSTPGKGSSRMKKKTNGVKGRDPFVVEARQRKSGPMQNKRLKREKAKLLKRLMEDGDVKN